ncbi:hypothetical protein [Sphingobacterium faecale]|uniref:Anti-sigma factor n=1 Tax=Sphingobacterium faecale TaxID=2803775 RepID=A0ABS1R4Q3_9SPHI|nr:hypothetical protein [Sphingobacterium faecale]MBL1409684.1 hypothetical protein [Sphingobacterium faecale]
MKEEEIDKLFRRAFHEAEETPTKNIWRQIEKQLDEKEQVIRIPSKRNTWFKYAAAAFLAFGTILTWLKLDNSNHLLTTDKSVSIIPDKDESPLPSIIKQEQPATPKVISNEITEKEKMSSTVILASKQVQSVVNNHLEQKRKKIELSTNDLEEVKPMLTSLQSQQQRNAADLPIRQVTEIEGIKPLISFDEETESMYAHTPHESSNQNIVTSILNTISDKLEISTTKDIRFRADEEGSFRVDIINSLVKNRKKIKR